MQDLASRQKEFRGIDLPPLREAQTTPKDPIFHDDRHYERFTRGLAEEVDRREWIVIAYCWMPNHIHALIRTPQPNLSRGMQHWLSGYANWYAQRNRRTGHVFQGRYKAFPVEDEGYYWNSNRVWRIGRM